MYRCAPPPSAARTGTRREQPLRALVDHAKEREEDVSFPTERQATTFRSYARLILMKLPGLYGLLVSNIPELLCQEAKQPSPG
jgi:hypothetical protein